VEKLLNGKHMVQELHRHEYFYVLALEKGKGTHEIDFTSYAVQNGSLFFMRPGQVHQLTLKAGGKGHMLQFNADFYSSNDKDRQLSLRKASSTNCHQLPLSVFKKLRLLLNSISEEIENKHEGYQDVIRANLGILFIELNRQTPTTRVNKAKTHTYDLLQNFLQLLEIHGTEHLTVADYADKMSLTIYQLNAITKETVGKTCSELINYQMILESKRHLLATSNQVNQIAYYLGYEDVSYFIRFFKKHTGYSPEAFREHFK
jgi:AraC family transcriptional regulator, transcriptional activator of pobA